MFLGMPLVADYQMLAKERERLINENLRIENLKRRREVPTTNAKNETISSAAHVVVRITI